MLQKCIMRDLATEREFLLSLPMEESELEKKISGKETIIIEANGPYPEISEFSSIRMINKHVEMLSEIQDEIGLTDKELRYLFQCSTLSVDETVQKIMDGEFILIDLDSVTADWMGSDEEKAAIYLNQQQIDILEPFYKCYPSTDGVVPKEMEDYVDWEKVWCDLNLEHGWVIIHDYSGDFSSTYLCRI